MKGFTLWFTGLSGSGKSTLAQEIEAVLLDRSVKVELLDGDEIRTHMSKGLGFSKEDRDTNIRRIGYVCKLLSRNGVAAISAAISPYREVRDEVRRQVQNFVEVYVECSIEHLKERDPKGLYAKAIAGEIDNFTGISDPYEPPDKPEVVVDTERESVRESVEKIVRTLELMGLVPAADEHADFSADEEAAIRDRLQRLGYL